MLAFLQLRADLQLVNATPQVRLISSQSGLGGRANERQAAEEWGVAAGNPRNAIRAIGSSPIAALRVVASQIDEAADAHIPNRVCRQSVRQMSKRHRGNRGVWTCRRDERRDQGWKLRVDPELVMETLDQLHAWCELPRQLREGLVLFVGPW